MLKFDFYVCQRVIAVLLMMSCTPSIAGPLSTALDSSSRRSIQEAKMQKYGTGDQAKNKTVFDAQDKNLNQFNNRPVEIVNTRNRRAKNKEKDCIVKVGNVVQRNTMRGTQQQSITVVEGDVINVCE